MPTFDAASSTSGTGQTSLTWSHTCTGTELALGVTVGLGDATIGNRTVSGVTYNGVSLTNAWAADDGTFCNSSGWYLKNPATGAHNIVVSIGGGGAQLGAAGGQSYTAVDQTTPTGTANSTTGSGTTASVNVTSASGEVVIGGISSDAQGAGAITPTGTQRWEVEDIGGDLSAAGQEYAGAGTVTVQWSQSSSTGFAIGGIPFKPSGGGGLTAAQMIGIFDQQLHGGVIGRLDA